MAGKKLQFWSERPNRNLFVMSEDRKPEWRVERIWKRIQILEDRYEPRGWKKRSFTKTEYKIIYSHFHVVKKHFFLS